MEGGFHMKKNGMRVTSLFLAAVMLASAPVTASAADTSANVEGEVVVDQTSRDQTSAESQNRGRAGSDFGRGAGSVTGFGSGGRCHGSKQ